MLTASKVLPQRVPRFPSIHSVQPFDAAAPMRRKVVLLVEDHEDSRYICSVILQHHGYSIMEAMDGDTGVQLAQQHLPDLILLDVTLPVLDGWAAAKRLRERQETSRIPIVALTAHAQRADQERGLRLGFAAYLIKPCSPTHVLEEVRRIIGAPTDPVRD
jgi:two-component system, cell cycle response regulator DivK